ncbi:MAG TPA: MOSC domain-containing protein [Candidatus Saccharimonadales bacterium]|nr:MOSC domain-containing protein [Candidatus Saccharimonadales bacterium]
MQLAELWRYPVKSMAGERVSVAELEVQGIPSDRGLAAFEIGPLGKEKPLSARDSAGLLKFRASLNTGTAQVAGPELEPTSWDHESVARSISKQCRRDLELRPVAGGAFDDSPILLIHLATVDSLSQEMGSPVDHRRFRANIYLQGAGIRAHGESELVGRELRCGAAILRVTDTCSRCAIPTRDPDTWASWPLLLRHLVQSHDEVVGVYCQVRGPGRLVEGDPVEIL